MKPEEKATNLKTSRQLLPIMGSLETEKVWIRIRPLGSTEWSGWRLWSRHFPFPDEETTLSWEKETVPAYDMPDLMGALPEEIVYQGICYEPAIYKWGVSYMSRFTKMTVGESLFAIEDGNNLIQALADLLIWLSDNGHMKEGE